MTATPQFAGNYWTRPAFGGSPAFERVVALAELPAHDQLIAALLRCDPERARDLLASHRDPTFADSLCTSPATGALSALLYSRIWKVGIGAELGNLTTSDHASALDIFRTGAAAASMKYAGYERLLRELLTVLGESAAQALFLKGTALSRSLYEEPPFRVSQDFDVLIPEEAAPEIVERLTTGGFQIEWLDPGHCHQSGVGPVGSLKALSLSPAADLTGCHNLLLRREGWPYLELKFEPLETGLRMREIERLFICAVEIDGAVGTLYAPDWCDHLMISLTHLHKHGFRGWSWLYDIHLLSVRLTGDEDAWSEFCRRCLIEGVSASAWAGLALASDRLGTPVPAEVMDSLAPSDSGPARRALTYTVNTEFLWNSASLPMLMLNARVLGDTERKWRALRQMVSPSPDFLSAYYAGGRHLSWWQRPLVLMLHWLVVLLPGGLIRRLFGRRFWKAPR